MKNMRQKLLYKPIQKWLESKGFQVLITGNTYKIVVPISDVVPLLYKIPDLVGIDKANKVVIVEVEKDKKNFFDVLGRCMLWKFTATFVYIAYPQNVFPRAKILKKLGIGLLNVNESNGKVEELITILPKTSIDLYKVLELHPLDSSKEQQLSKQVKDILDYEK